MVTGRLANRYKVSRSLVLENSVSVSGIPLGATNSRYATIAGKEYNTGPGAAAKASASCEIVDYGALHVNYWRYWIHTLSGARGDEFVGLLGVGVKYHLSANSSLGFDFKLYDRCGNYTQLPDTRTVNTFLRTYVMFVL